MIKKVKQRSINVSTLERTPLDTQHDRSSSRIRAYAVLHRASRMEKHEGLSPQWHETTHLF